LVYIVVFVLAFFSPNRKSDGWANWRLALLWFSLAGCMLLGRNLLFFLTVPTNVILQSSNENGDGITSTLQDLN